VAVCSSFLILRLPERKGDGNGTWAAIESNLDDVGDIDGVQATLLCAIGLHEKRERLCNANGI